MNLYITRNSVFVLIMLLVISCERKTSKHCSNSPFFNLKSDNRISVLNFSTFHMGETSDAHKTIFDENDSKNQNQVRDIAKMLSKFKPTIIVIEVLPERTNFYNELYQKYILNPEHKIYDPSEIELLAFEVGRLSHTKKLYGVDYTLEYNYNIAHQIKNEIDSTMYNNFCRDPFNYYPDINPKVEQLPLLEKLKVYNSKSFLDFLININSEILSHVGTKYGFEGADEATKLYARNLKMYSNLNRIPVTKKDRIFILLGGCHTAYFRDFLSHSPKYKMVNTFDYLK